ncbi:MAG: hypothetical protein Q7S86_04730 [bacterium]|nr:hypothetical protein [bacterium]
MSPNHKKTLALPILLVLIAIMFFAVSPKQSTAQGYVPLAPIEGTFNPATGKTDLSTYLTGIFKVGVAGAGALAFLMIVWGGFTYLSTDVITGKEEGKARIERAVGGLILALTSYIILNTINPKLVELDLYFGQPADQGKMSRLEKPDDVTYSQQLDDMLADLNRENARPEVIAAKEAKGKALDAAVAVRELTGRIDALDPGSPERVALETQRTAIDTARQTLLVKAAEADVVAAKARLNDASKLAISNLGSTKDVLMIMNQMNISATKDIAEMNNLGLTAKAQIIETEFVAARTAVVQADINRGNTNVAKGVMDIAYKEQQASIRLAAGNTAKIAAANQKAAAVISSVQAQCQASSTLLSCRNYNPATNPANKP